MSFVIDLTFGIGNLSFDITKPLFMQNIIQEINILAAKINRQIVLMELCGTHTEAVARHGIKKLLPKNIKLLSGPGCPVCVTDQQDINAVIALALEGIPVACYGDVLRVPGTLQLSRNVITRSSETTKPAYRTGRQSQFYRASHGIATLSASGRIARNDNIINLSLDKAREFGADITEVYSVEDALKLQEKKPNIVFFGLGFETTAPMTASAIKRGLTVYSSHKAFVPAMAALLATPVLKIDGFINPGHVSAIIGTEPYKKLNRAPSVIARSQQATKPAYRTGRQSRVYSTSHGIASLPPVARNDKSIPQVIAGFEANDIIIAIYMLLKQIAENRTEVENEYTRSVRPEGNPKARELINEVFETGDAYWRGIGKIPSSGFDIRPKYSEFDAKVKYKKILYGCHPEPPAGGEGSRPLKDVRAIPRDSSVVSLPQNDINTKCICGAILRGLKEPKDCKLFNKKCTPDNPVGACMVSSEGACGIEAKFRE